MKNAGRFTTHIEMTKWCPFFDTISLLKASGNYHSSIGVATIIPKQSLSIAIRSLALFVSDPAKCSVRPLCGQPTAAYEY